MGFVSQPGAARADNPVDYLVHDAKLALPYYPQFGLEPNIYYIPPIHAERGYLRQMFGPDVDATIERYQKVWSDPVARGLLCLIGSTDKILHRFKVEHGTAIGFDEAGAELVRVPVVEPVIERAAYDRERGVVRNNTP
jgi:nitrate reductase beta subunit